MHSHTITELTAAYVRHHVVFSKCNFNSLPKRVANWTLQIRKNMSPLLTWRSPLTDTMEHPVHFHHFIKSPHFLRHAVCNYTNDMMQFCCSSIFELEGVPHLLSKKTTRLGMCINWSKTKLMHVGDDLINCPSSLAETLLSSPWLSYTWAQKFPILLSSSQRLAEDMGWVQVSWDLWRLLWWHYKSLDAPSYKFIMLSSSLYYYTAARHGLSVRPLPLTFMNDQGVHWSDLVSNAELH